MVDTIMGDRVTDQIWEGQYFLTAGGAWYQYTPERGYIRMDVRTARCLRVWLAQIKASRQS
jgi:hypothetical protein